MTKHRLVALLGIALLAALAVAPGRATAQASEYHAVLSGDNEVPPVTTSATGTFTMSVDGLTANWTLNVPSIEGATQAHIHLGSASESGEVVVALFNSETPVNSISESGTITELVGPLAGDVVGFGQALASGNLYVNVHTQANPPGEIRGQIQTGPLPAPSAAGTGSAGLAAGSGTPALEVLAMLALLALVAIGGRAAMRVR